MLNSDLLRLFVIDKNAPHRSPQVVRIGEKPAKVVKALMSMKRKLLQEADAPAPTVELFGPWQVEDYVPPVAENGIVPRNEHGNVELFKPCMLPIGCTHMKLPGKLILNCFGFILFSTFT